MVVYSGGVSTSRPEKTFTVLGFKDWKHATGKDGILKGHDNSHSHKQAAVAWTEFQKMNSSIVDTLGGARQELIQKNRHYLKTLCEIILLCCNQETALHGHRENEASINKGNFIEILNLVAKHDEVVSSRLSYLPKMLYIYTSPKVQNDLLHIMAGTVRKGITLAVQNADYILADESKDISKQEQLVIVLRYVNMATCNVYERFLTFVKAESLNAESLSDYIFKTLRDYNLDPALIVSQGYDGASVMSGSCSGVQQRIIKMIALNATYVHCYAHCLNLVLVDCVRKVQDASEFFALMELLYVFISSTKAHELFLKKQAQLHPDKQTHQLQRHSDTRWACGYFAVDAICCTYDCVIATLEAIADDDDKCKAVEAKGIICQVRSFKFLLLLIFFSHSIFYQEII